MQGICLSVFVHENRRHHGRLLYEWLLEEARKLGIQGGSAFRAVAGFGRHGVVHEERFFELAADLPVMIMFSVTDEECDQFLAHLDAEKISLFFMRTPAQFGRIDGDT